MKDALIAARNNYYEKRMVYKKVCSIVYDKKTIVDKIISVVDSMIEMIDSTDSPKKAELNQMIINLLECSSSLIDESIGALLNSDSFVEYQNKLNKISAFVSTIVCTVTLIYDYAV